MPAAIHRITVGGCLDIKRPIAAVKLARTRLDACHARVERCLLTSVAVALGERGREHIDIAIISCPNGLVVS